VESEAPSYDMNGSEENTVQPQGWLAWVVKFLEAVAAGLVATFTYETLQDAYNKLRDYWRDEGNYTQYGLGYKVEVKVEGDEFDANDRSNWVGNGYTNKTIRVNTLQRALHEYGLNPGPIDGIWGPKTRTALIQFQAAEGLSADGICGTKTWEAMASDD
jgi:Putative peptidoglycan binding domain